MSQVERALSARVVNATSKNDQSSRGHFLFTLRISQIHEVSNRTLDTRILLVDLAGSERKANLYVS